MSYFGSALKQVLETLDWKQIELAEKTSITPSQINRYIRGVHKDIPADTVGRVIAAIPASHHPRLLVAYLRDQVPDGYAAQVDISSALPNMREDAPASLLLPTIDPEVDGILRIYADLAMRHEEVKTMLKSFLVAMRLWPARGDAEDKA